MCGFVQRMVAAPDSPRTADSLVVDSDPGILAITADLRFYSSVLSAACSWGWSAEWATSLTRGLEICESRPIRIVIYDRNVPAVDWRYALDRLRASAATARVLVAAPRIDEDLWRTVLRRHGYDVLARTATSAQLRRELRLAWLSLCEAERHERSAPLVRILTAG